MFDGKFIGYVAIGQDIFMRPIAGQDCFLFSVPADLDSHNVAAALNNSANVVFEMIRSLSQFKF